MVNLDLPWDTETYLHRVGRAGRFGGYATALSLVTEEDELKKLKRISEEIGYDMRLLSGELLFTSSNKINKGLACKLFKIAFKNHHYCILIEI